MKNKLLATIGAAAFALSVSATASFAGYMQPGETMGLSLDSPLPEGVFAADLENYGRSPNVVPGFTAGVGVNIPVLLWSTPFTFYNNRLEFLAAFPFAHIDGLGGAGLSDRVGAITFAFGPIIAHDFGNGLTGGVSAFIRTPSPSQNIQGPVDGRTVTEVDFRESLQYIISAPGIFNGVTLMENGAYTSCLCSNYGPLTAAGTGVQNDMFAGDFTVEKSFDKLTLGFVGYGNVNVGNRNNSPGVGERNIALGGLVGYDFGRFSLTGMVTRTVIDRAIVPGVSAGYETRGWLRAIIPLYVAPTAPAPVIARY